MKNIKNFVLNHVYTTFAIFVTVILCAVLTGALLTQRSFRHEELLRFRHIFANAVRNYEEEIEFERTTLTSLSALLKGESLTVCKQKLATIDRKLETTDDFENIGIIDLNGRAYFSDEIVVDLSKNHAFQHAREGHMVIRNRLDKFPGSPVPHVQSLSPVYNNENTVTSVIITTYPAYGADSDLNLKFNNELLPTFVMEPNGRVFCRNLSNIDTDNLLKTIVSKNKKSGEQLKQAILDDIKSESNNELSCTLNEPGTLFYAPLRVNFDGTRYYLVSFLPNSILEEGVTFFWGQFKNFLFFGTILICLLAGSLLLLYQNLHNKLQMLTFTSSETNAPNLPKLEADVAELAWSTYCLMAMRLSGFYECIQYRNSTGVKDLLNKIWTILLPHDNDKVKIAHNHDDIYIFAMNMQLEEVPVFVKTLTNTINKFVQINSMGALRPCFCITSINSSEEQLNEVITTLIGRIQTADFSNTDNNYFIVDKNQNAILSSGNGLQNIFENAINNNEFVICYSPMTDSQENIIGAKATVQWHSQGQIMNSEEFSDILDRNGLLARLDNYRLRSICKQLRIWKEMGKTLVPISTFLSGYFLYDTDLTEQLKNTVDLTGIDPQQIILEFNENEIAQIQGAKTAIQEIKDLGFKICLGGYTGKISTFKDMNNFVFDVLSINKKIMHNINQPTIQKILESIIQLTKKLNLKIRLCSVDNEEIRQIISNYAYDEKQGTAISPALSAEDFEKLLNERILS